MASKFSINDASRADELLRLYGVLPVELSEFIAVILDEIKALALHAEMPDVAAHIESALLACDISRTQS